MAERAVPGHRLNRLVIRPHQACTCMVQEAVAGALAARLALFADALSASCTIYHEESKLMEKSTGGGTAREASLSMVEYLILGRS